MQVLVKDLKVGDKVWSGRNIVKVIEVREDRVSVRKLDAPEDSISQWSIIFYTSLNDDLMARITLASEEQCSSYLAKSQAVRKNVEKQFNDNFPS